MFVHRSAFTLILLIKIAAVEVMSAAISGNEEEIEGNRCNATTFNDKLCSKPACIHAASSILKNMDMSINPCDNFYQFACKGFIDNTRIPEGKGQVGSSSLINDKLMEQVYDVLDSPVTEHDIRPFKLAKELYKSCMNKESIEKIGTTHMRQIFKKMGGWPVLEGDRWDESGFDWILSVNTFHKIGYSTDYFLRFSVVPDLKNTSANIILLDQAYLRLDQKYLVKGLENKVVSAYYKFMVDIAVLFGAEKDKAESEMKESLEFEIALAKISLPSEERRNITRLYNRMTITELQTNFPSIPWHNYFQELLPEKIVVRKDEVIVVSVPSFIANLEALISKTPKRILANYAVGRAAAFSVPFLSEEFRNILLVFTAAQYGKTEHESRWKECVVTTNNVIPLAVGSLYVCKYMKEDIKQNVLEMVNRIREEMYKILENIPWMDEKTRTSALEKVKSMVSHIAYPDELLDDSKLEKYFEKLEVDPDDFLGTILNIIRFVTEYKFGRLREPVNKTEWITHGIPTVVNARYTSNENSIQLFAGILQGLFYNKDHPNYMNYGGIGSVIGHEITHGFDDMGNQFDKNGNLVDWWQDVTKKQYIEKATCIIHQYGNYTDNQVNMKLNGINTQGENIADNGGIKEAYRAYSSWMKQNGPEQHLPGLQMFTPQQMFWISAANNWCSVYRSKYLKNVITTDPHSPNEFRVLGSFSNQEDFARDFKCPVDSKMNPAKKCTVW